MKRCKSGTKISIIIIITLAFMGVSSIIVYRNVSQPKFYKLFMNLGKKYLAEDKYEEAIIEFSKVIHIEENSTDARIEIAKSYIGEGDINSAINILKEAQNIDLGNSNLLIEILEILKDIDTDISYQILQNYIENVGEDNISDEIKGIIDLSNEQPKEPSANPKIGTYIKPLFVKLESDQIRVGHNFYYTTDGSKPTKNSKEYKGNIYVEESTEIKVVGYNKKAETTKIISLEYIIDKELMKQIEESINESEKLINNTQVGTDIGNCIKGSKEVFEKNTSNIKKAMEEPIISYDKGITIKEELKQTKENFKDKIIEQTYKSELKELIEKARYIHDKAIEGNKNGEFKIGSKAKLMIYINEADKVYKDILSKQKHIDASESNLKKAIDQFHNSNVKVFSEDVAIQYAVDYFYTKPYKNKKYDEEGDTYFEGRGYFLGEKIIIDGKEFYEAYIDCGAEGKGWQIPILICENRMVYNMYSRPLQLMDKSM